MEKFGEIEIRVVGKKGSLELSPDNYDIREIAEILVNVESLLYPSSKKERPIISYNIQEGSVRHVFKTGVQAIIGFGAIMTQIANTGSIDFLELKTAKALESIQYLSYEKNYHFELHTLVNEIDPIKLEISPSTRFIRTENLWLESEVYLYGVLTNAGGKSRANIHLDTKQYGSLTVQTDKEFLEGQEDNLLYKKFGVRAFAMQNVETGEIDKSTLKMIELIDYNPKFDKAYLDDLIVKAKKHWLDIDSEDWLNDLRGGYEA